MHQACGGSRDENGQRPGLGRYTLAGAAAGNWACLGNIAIARYVTGAGHPLVCNAGERHQAQKPPASCARSGLGCSAFKLTCSECSMCIAECSGDATAAANSTDTSNSRIRIWRNNRDTMRQIGRMGRGGGGLNQADAFRASWHTAFQSVSFVG